MTCSSGLVTAHRREFMKKFSVRGQKAKLLQRMFLGDILMKNWILKGSDTQDYWVFGLFHRPVF
jgi:hypothetical protein